MDNAHISNTFMAQQETSSLMFIPGISGGLGSLKTSKFLSQTAQLGAITFWTALGWM